MDYLWILPDEGLAIGDPESGELQALSEDEYEQIMDEYYEAHQAGQIH